MVTSAEEMTLSPRVMVAAMISALVRHDHLVGPFALKRDAFKRRPFPHPVTAALDASGPEVHFKHFHLVVFPFREPAAFLGRIGESGEDALRRRGIAPFNDEGVVDYQFVLP